MFRAIKPSNHVYPSTILKAKRIMSQSVTTNHAKSFPLISVVAATPNHGIGMKGMLPWQFKDIALPEDMAHFKHITSSVDDPNKRNAVISGKDTWFSIPEQFRPLSNRINIVISRTLNKDDVKSPDVYIASSFQDALDLIGSNEYLRNAVESVVVIGGARLFEESLEHPWFSKCFYTAVETDFECDVHLSDRTVQYMRDNMVQRSGGKEIDENGVKYRYSTQ